MFNRLFKTLTSLRLTVVLLCAGLVLVFLGTLAQEPLGLYAAQQRFFRSFFVDAGSMFAALHKAADMIMQGFGRSLAPLNPQDVQSSAAFPAFPGGYLVGTLLLANLLAAHVTRFKFTRKKVGILLVHAGIVMLLVGQMLTDLLARESYMQLSTEGPAKYYSESGLRNELAVIDVTDAGSDQVIAIPESRLQERGEIRDSRLPFAIRVRQYAPNSLPQLLAPMAGQTQKDVQGIGKFIAFATEPVTARTDARNLPAATVEIVAGKETLGTWEVSNWLSEPALVEEIRQQSGGALGDGLGAPQEFKHGGRTFRLAMRPVRYYHPFSIQLLHFNHAVYRGTDIPKDFTSRIRLSNPGTGEDREVKIYMNNPLRYAGTTFYQGSFDPKDPRVSILQVVKNPSWLTPYFSCALVALGLIVQFLTHLIGFAAKWKHV